MTGHRRLILVLCMQIFASVFPAETYGLGTALLLEEPVTNELFDQLEKTEFKNSGGSDDLAKSVAKVTASQLLKPRGAIDLEALGARIFILPFSETRSATVIPEVSAEWIKIMTVKLEILNKYGEIDVKGYGLAVTCYSSSDPCEKNEMQAVFVVIFEDQIHNFFTWTPTLQNSNAHAILLASRWSLDGEAPTETADGEIDRINLKQKTPEDEGPFNEQQSKTFFYGISYKLDRTYDPKDTHMYSVFVIICEKPSQNINLDATPSLVHSRV